jgi:hypothetical protein
MAAKTLTARTQFVAEIDGKTVVVLPGARFPVASAVVKDHRQYFEPAVEAAKEKRGAY